METGLTSIRDNTRFDEMHADLARLLRALRRAKGFALYLAQCESPIYQSKIVDNIRSRTNRQIINIELTNRSHGPLNRIIQEKLRSATVDSVAFVFGLEDLLRQSRHRMRILRELNLGRNTFATIGHPVVLWLPRFAVDLISRYAPDYYDWYSGLYEFDTPHDLLLRDYRIQIAARVGRRLRNAIKRIFPEWKSHQLCFPLFALEPAVMAKWNADVGNFRTAQNAISICQWCIEESLRSDDALETLNIASADTLQSLGAALHRIGDISAARLWMELHGRVSFRGPQDSAGIEGEMLRLEMRESLDINHTESVLLCLLEYVGILLDQDELNLARSASDASVELANIVLSQSHPLRGVLLLLNGEIHAKLAHPDEFDLTTNAGLAVLGAPMDLNSPDFARELPQAVFDVLRELLPELTEVDPVSRIGMISDYLDSQRPASRIAIAGYYFAGLSIDEIAGVQQASPAVIWSAFGEGLVALLRQHRTRGVRNG